MAQTYWLYPAAPLRPQVGAFLETNWQISLSLRRWHPNDGRGPPSLPDASVLTDTPLQTSKVLDAVRAKDGQMVVIKHDSKSIHPYESDIAMFLSSPPLSNDPRNHCCPILEVFDDPYDPDRRLMVMPLLRTYNDPKFATVGEAVEFIRQAFEVGTYSYLR